MVNLQVHPSTYSEVADNTDPSTAGQSTDRFSTNRPSYPSIDCLIDSKFVYYLPRLCPNRFSITNGASTYTLGVDCLRGLVCLGHHLGSFLKDIWIVLRDVWPGVSNSNILLYEFSTYHINLIQNESVKLDKTCLDTQGHFKEKFSNVMDVWPPNFMKLDTHPIHTIITHLSTL